LGKAKSEMLSLPEQELRGYMWKLSILQSSRASTLILNVVHDDCYGYI
jgi:hypothetical protein